MRCRGGTIVAIAACALCACTLLLDDDGLASGAAAPNEAGVPETSAPDAPSTGSGYVREVLADAPVLYLRLGAVPDGGARDEISGGTYAMPGAFEPGQSGALANDGDPSIHFVNGYVDLGDRYDFSAGEGFSLEAWVNVDMVSGNYWTIIGKFDPYDSGIGNVGYGLGVTSSGNRGFFFTRNGTNVSDFVDTGVLPTALVWMHVVGVFDRVTQSIYIDGALARGLPGRAAIPDTRSTLRVGRGDFDSTAFHGRIDEVAIYPRPLTAQRIAAHYAAAR
jgi:hypothetical protein